MIRHRVLLLAALLCVCAVAATTLKPLKTWTGHMPIVIQQLMQSSVTSAADWQRVWATCQMKDAPPEVDFATRMVLIAVRRSSKVTFTNIKIDQGNLTTSIAVAPDSPSQYTCAFALVDRTGVTSLNGAPLGK